MKRWLKWPGAILATAALAAILLLPGCEGTESRSQVDDTVEELSGKKQVERMKDMKKDLEDIQTQQADRLKELQNSD